MSHDPELSLRPEQLDLPPSAAEMAGDETCAAIWFQQQPIPACGSRTAHDLVGEGKANAVLVYLGVRAGAYA
jgi:hypothetical protein